MNYQVIVTASGLETINFEYKNSLVTKHDVMIGEKFLLERAFESYGCQAQICSLIFLDEVKNSKAINRITRNFPHVIPKSAFGETQGALCSALLSIDQLDLSLPTFVVPGDSYITENVEEIFQSFIESEAVAGTLLFNGSGDRWSYARLDQENRVLEMAEKSEISGAASTGVFFFRSASVFIDAAEWVLLNNMRTAGHFYVSSAINYLALNGKLVIGNFLQDSRSYIPMSRPSDVAKILELNEKI